MYVRVCGCCVGACVGVCASRVSACVWVYACVRVCVYLLLSADKSSPKLRNEPTYLLGRNSPSGFLILILDKGSFASSAGSSGRMS